MSCKCGLANEPSLCDAICGTTVSCLQGYDCVHGGFERLTSKNGQSVR